VKKRSKKLGTLAVGSFIVLAGCSSAPKPNPHIQQLEIALSQAYADPYVADRGATQLRQAEETLRAARSAWMDKKEPVADHNTEMTEAYLQLANIKGAQAKTAADIEKLKSAQGDVRVEARERQLSQAQMQAEQEAAKARAMQAELEQAKSALKEYEIQQRELGATLVLQDVMFEVNSANLRPGAENRLQPLIKYLQANSATNIRIEGHTDSTGSDSYNEALSARRAEAVGAELGRAGIDRARIQTVGMGESKPIASNDTVSGREQNRRVEVTLIQTATRASAPAAN
jgi:outer membrane protein OmpA-like peptidoglycan-associated protein